MQILLIQLTSTNNVGDAFQNDFNLKMQVLAYLIPQLQLTSLAERGMLLDALINRDGTIFHDATVMESSTSCSYQGIFRTDRWMGGLIDGWKDGLLDGRSLGLVGGRLAGAAKPGYWVVTQEVRFKEFGDRE